MTPSYTALAKASRAGWTADDPMNPTARSSMRIVRGCRAAVAEGGGGKGWYLWLRQSVMLLSPVVASPPPLCEGAGEVCEGLDGWAGEAVATSPPSVGHLCRWGTVAVATSKHWMQTLYRCYRYLRHDRIHADVTSALSQCCREPLSLLDHRWSTSSPANRTRFVYKGMLEISKPPPSHFEPATVGGSWEQQGRYQ